MSQTNRAAGMQVRLVLASWGACLFGAVITLVFCQGYQFNWDMPVPLVNVPFWLAAGLVALALLVGARIALGLRLRPLWTWTRQAGSGSPAAADMARVRGDALNLPAYYAAYVWFLWLVVAFVFAMLVEGSELAFVEVLAGVGILAGFSSAVLEYFLVELAWRKEVPHVFGTGELAGIPAFRLRLRTRLLLLFILGLVPLILSVLLVRSRTVEILLGSGGILLAFLLTRLSGAAVARPLEAITPRLRAVQEGKLDERVDVTSNDELGELAARFNGMVAGVRQRNSEVETIYHISQEITDSLELDQTLQAILEEVRKIIPYDGGEICLYDKRDNLLHVRAWSSSASGFIMDTRGRTYKLGEGYTGWVGGERRSLLIPDVDAHEGQKPTIRQIADGVILNGYLGVPLVVKGNKMVGTLEIVSTKTLVFDEHSRQILEIIAPQAAIAIENAEQVLERERELKAQIERLKVEIDDVKRAKQVADITETAYFRNLKEQAKRLRKTQADEDGGGG
jgi:HAMP domain-containing protein